MNEEQLELAARLVCTVVVIKPSSTTTPYTWTNILIIEIEPSLLQDH